MQLTLNDFQLRDEIYFPKNSELLANAPTKGLWENEAKRWERVGYGEILDGHGYPWNELPVGKHFDAILDLGCGYGRHYFYMSKYREITWNKYYGFDIAENMLRRFLRLRQEDNFLPSAEFSLFCIPPKF